MRCTICRGQERYVGKLESIGAGMKDNLRERNLPEKGRCCSSCGAAIRLKKPLPARAGDRCEVQLFL